MKAKTTVKPTTKPAVKTAIKPVAKKLEQFTEFATMRCGHEAFASFDAAEKAAQNKQGLTLAALRQVECAQWNGPALKKDTLLLRKGAQGWSTIFGAVKDGWFVAGKFALKMQKGDHTFKGMGEALKKLGAARNVKLTATGKTYDRVLFEDRYGVAANTKAGTWTRLERNTNKRGSVYAFTDV